MEREGLGWQEAFSLQRDAFCDRLVIESDQSDPGEWLGKFSD